MPLLKDSPKSLCYIMIRLYEEKYPESRQNPPFLELVALNPFASPTSPAIIDFRSLHQSCIKVSICNDY